MKLPNFGQTTTTALAVLVAVNAWLCYNGKRLEAENQAIQTEIALVQNDNRNLAEQIKTANQSIQHYREQVKALHLSVLAKMQQAEERTNEIMQELDKYQDWATQSLPDGIERLLNQHKADRALSSDSPYSPTLSKPQSMPQTDIEHQKQP